MEYNTDPECSNHLVPFNIVPVVNYQGAGCTLIGHIYPDYQELMNLFWLYSAAILDHSGPSSRRHTVTAVNHCKASEQTVQLQPGVSLLSHYELSHLQHSGYIWMDTTVAGGIILY